MMAANPQPHGGSRRGPATAPAPPKPSALEIFWGQITCNPVVDPGDDDMLTFQREQAALLASREVYKNPEERKRQSDLDLIDRRLREAAVKRRQDRAGADEQNLLGADLVAERQRLAQEETYRKERADEFEAKQRAAVEAKREAEKKQGAVGSFFSAVPDVTFGLSSALSKALAPTSGFEADSATESVSTLCQQDRDRFDQLLGIEGLAVLVYLPTRDGGSKTRRAVLRCDRNSTSIVCEIESKKERTKTIKFDVRIVKAVRVGAGKTVPVPVDPRFGDARRFHFVLQDKPDLTCELETSDARDVALSGFVYIVSTRRSPLYSQQIRLAQPMTLGKGGQHAHKPSRANSDRQCRLTGWSRWYDVVEKGMLRTKYKPRLFLTTTKYELEVYAPPDDKRDEWPADMVGDGPLRRYVDAQWSPEALEEEGFEFAEGASEKLACVQAVTAIPGRSGEHWVAVAFEDSDKPTLTLRVPSQGEQKYLIEFLTREMKAARALLRQA